MLCNITCCFLDINFECVQAFSYETDEISRDLSPIFVTLFVNTQ